MNFNNRNKLNLCLFFTNGLYEFTGTYFNFLHLQESTLIFDIYEMIRFIIEKSFSTFYNYLVICLKL